MTWGHVWEDVFREHEGGKYTPEDFVRFIARNFYKAKDRKEIKILEVGCGLSANLWYIAREGFSVYDIDGSETAIKKAKERLDRECQGWSGKLTVGDIIKLPYEDEFFDGVVDNEAIYCNSYENSKIIYKELARVAKKNGKLFLRTFSQDCWGDGTGNKGGRNAWAVSEGPLLDKGYARFTDLNEIPDLLSGFNLTEVELLTRTMGNRKHEIKEWLIMGERK